MMFPQIFFSRARQILRIFYKKQVSKIQSSRNLCLASFGIFPLALYLNNQIVKCEVSEGKQTTNENLQQVSMSQLVRLLQEQSEDFVIIVYNKFQKTNHPGPFAALLKDIVQECKKSKINKIYAISARQEQYLREITRRLRNQALQQKGDTQSQPKDKKKVISCYFKSNFYKQAFELVDSKDYKISQQIKQIKHFQIKVNNPKLNEELIAFDALPFDINKTIVVQQCTGQGECVQSYKKSVKKLLDSGLLTKKTDQYQFQLVINYPTRILNKSTDYVKNFQSCVSSLLNRQISHKKEETYLFRRDVIGKEAVLFSQWIAKEENSYSQSENLMMFIRPRVNIISKMNTFTDLMWYVMTNRLSNNLCFSINNTQKWAKFNKVQTLDVLKLLYSFYPKLSYLIVNSSSAGDMIHHIHASHKYVIFQLTRDQIWNKKFLELDVLQKIQNPQQRHNLFKTNFKQEIDSFIKKPEVKDFIAVEKQLQISLQKLRTWKQEQKIGEKTKQRLIRVCQERCHRFLNDELLQSIAQRTNQELKVYWIDSKTQNIGVKPGDYLLKEGRLVQIAQILKN